MARNRLLEGDVRAVARGGDAVVETTEGVVLVPGALPGERVELTTTGSKRGAARGRLTRVLEPSTGRVEPTCRYFSRCGGCPMMIADATAQRDIKLALLMDACRGVPGVDDVAPRWISSPEALGYRRRARFAWHGSSFGYRAFHSKRVNDIDECAVVMPEIATAWTAARTHLTDALSGSGDIQLQVGREGRVVVAIHTRDEQEARAFAACERLSVDPSIAGVSLGRGPDVAPATWGEETVVLFAQANDGINAELVSAVADLADPDGLRVLELHSGVGNFTTALAARKPSTLVAVERDARAVAVCQAALERRGLSARVTVGDANRPPKGHYDVVVLDPPREGARSLFEHESLWPGPKRIVYVSCDTATLGRDLRLVSNKGYRVDHILGFDMFPQTAHLESLVRLVRA